MGIAWSHFAQHHNTGSPWHNHRTSYASWNFTTRRCRVKQHYIGHLSIVTLFLFVKHNIEHNARCNRLTWKTHVRLLLVTLLMFKNYTSDGRRERKGTARPCIPVRITHWRATNAVTGFISVVCSPSLLSERTFAWPLLGSTPQLYESVVSSNM